MPAVLHKYFGTKRYNNPVPLIPRFWDLSTVEPVPKTAFFAVSAVELVAGVDSGIGPPEFRCCCGENECESVECQDEEPNPGRGEPQAEVPQCS